MTEALHKFRNDNNLTKEEMPWCAYIRLYMYLQALQDIGLDVHGGLIRLGHSRQEAVILDKRQ